MDSPKGLTCWLLKKLNRKFYRMQSSADKNYRKTFEQTARYNSVLGAGEIILSNGLQHIYASLTQNGYQFSNFGT